MIPGLIWAHPGREVDGDLQVGSAVSVPAPIPRRAELHAGIRLIFSIGVDHVRIVGCQVKGAGAARWDGMWPQASPHTDPEGRRSADSGDGDAVYISRDAGGVVVLVGEAHVNHVYRWSPGVNAEGDPVLDVDGAVPFHMDGDDIPVYREAVVLGLSSPDWGNQCQDHCQDEW